MANSNELKKYAKYIPAVKEVYKLAVRRNGNKNENEWEEIIQGDPYSDPVFDYLLTLGMDSVNVIQVLMYTGRDYRFPEKTVAEIDYDIERNGDGEDTVFLPLKKVYPENPDQVIDDYMAEQDKNGWKSQDIEADQISSKSPLAEYLKRAFEILGVR